MSTQKSLSTVEETKQVYVRSMYVAPKGYTLISVDLSQAESWIVAFLANEPNMKYSLQFSDIHRDTAGNALFYGNTGCEHTWEPITGPSKCTKCNVEVSKTARYIGKRYNHASAYRMKPPRAAQVINKDSDKPPFVTVTLEESRHFSDAWHNYYSIKPWWFAIEEQLDKDRTLITPYRRKRTFFDVWGDELFREATAYVPQSTVADHFDGQIQPELGIPGGLREIKKQLISPYNDHRITNQSHDSCIVECPSFVALEICERMKALLKRPLIINGEEFTIPVDGEMGERWGELKAA